MTDEERRERDRVRKNKRYSEDKEFREQARARARERYTPVPERERSERTRGRNKPRVLPINGELQECVGLGTAADLLGVHKTTLRGYDDRGVIPQNRIVDGLGRRWYPRVFIELLQPIFAAQSEARQPLWRLRGEVQRAWAEAVQDGKCPIVQAIEETPHE